MPNRRDQLLIFYKGRSGDRPPLIRTDPRTLAYFGVMLLLIGLAGWLYLHQASRVAAYAHEIRQLQQEKDRLHRQMIALRADVALKGSLRRITQEGDAMGYHLPDASASAQHLRVEYVRPPREPATAVARADAPRGGGTLSTAPAPANWFEEMVHQLETWLEAPVDE
jgi:hypothetical protein